VFSDENRTQKYLDVEAALAKAQARLGLHERNALLGDVAREAGHALLEIGHQQLQPYATIRLSTWR
jgi:adenylosuccinate lyase